MRSHEWMLGLVRERLMERQRLHAKFIAEADRNLLLIASTGSKSIDNVMPLLSLYAEISLLSTDAVRQGAQRVCDSAISANSLVSDEPDGDHFAAKSAFVDMARSELRAIEARARSGESIMTVG
jgi:hypothetical protein